MYPFQWKHDVKIVPTLWVICSQFSIILLMRNLTTNVFNFSSLLFFHFQLLQLRKDATWGFPHLLTFAFCPQIPHSPTIPNGFHPASRAEEKKLSLTIFLQFATCDVWIVWSLDHQKEGRNREGSNKEFSSRPKMPLLVLFSLRKTRFMQ